MQSAVIINLPKRDIRISAFGIRTGVQSNADGISAFVTAITQRYTASSAIFRQIPMLLTSPVGITLKPTYQTNQLSWSPHLKLSVFKAPSSELSQGDLNIIPNTISHPSPNQKKYVKASGLPLQIQPQILKSIERHTEILSSDHLTHHLITRWQRTDSIPSQHTHSQPSPTFRVPPVPRIVRQSSMNDNPGNVSTPPSRYRSSPPTIWEEQNVPNRSISKSPEVNIHQITDQVVRAIDRRLIAYRERMGRV
mgnify:CR=1 FL=1